MLINARISRSIVSVLLVFSMLFALSPAGIAMGSTNFEKAPANPDYLNYSGTGEWNGPPGTAPGIIPSRVDLSHLVGKSIPGAYNIVGAPLSPPTYDLRDEGRVTPVRDQGSAGACWTFATYGSLESSLLPGVSADFSENNMKNLLSQDYSEGYDRLHSGGGNEFMSTAYLARWSGPVNEAADSYNAISGTSSVLPAQKHVQEVLFLPNRANKTDNETIKNALMTYGALYASYHHDDAYYYAGLVATADTASFYYNGNKEASLEKPNHGITIVGWDDSYAETNFNSTAPATQPPGPGAFLVKNSWGTAWGDNGYFWMSYYDDQLGNFNSFNNAEATTNYQNIYQYDPLGWNNSLGAGTNTLYGANIFTASGDQAVKAVSFYTPAINSQYEISVYSGVTAVPTDGVLGSTKSGTITYAGYHTIPLDTPVNVINGSKFSVVVRLVTPGYNFPMALEDNDVLTKSTKATAAAGQSFVSDDNAATWDDLTTIPGFEKANVTIKAFTDTLVPAETPTGAPVSGEVFSDTELTLASTTPGVQIRYTFGDGSQASPTASTGTVYNPAAKPLITTAGTYKVRAFKPGVGDSAELVLTYTVTPAVEAPIGDPVAGAVVFGTELTLTTATPGAEIRYTFGDGSQAAPTVSTGTVYNPASKPLIDAEGTYKVKAFKAGMSVSSELSLAYTQAQVANLTAEPVSGPIAFGTELTLTTATAGAEIRYTFGDGSQAAPTASTGTVYNPASKPLIDTEGTYKVKAFKTGMSVSNELSLAYTQAQVAAPIANPGARPVGLNTSVTLNSTTVGAAIYYTTDGSTPDATKTLYSAPIVIDAAKTIKAIAVKAGMLDSSILTSSYTIQSSGGGGGGTIQPTKIEIKPVHQGITTVITGDDKILNDSLKATGEAKFDLAKATNGAVNFSAVALNELAQINKVLVVANEDIAIKFDPSTLKADLIAKTSLEQGEANIMVRAISNNEKTDLLSKTRLGQSTGIFEIGGKIFDLSAQVKTGNSGTTQKIDGFTNPVAVTINLSHLQLTEAQLKQLSGVRLEKDATGNVIPVKLGGIYDPLNKTFTFYTDKFSYYTVLSSPNLIYIDLMIGRLTAIANGEGQTIDVAPTLINNRTMVPIRFIGESLGTNFTWDDATKTVIFTQGAKTMKLTIGKTGSGLDTPPVLINGRTMVPLRYISEAFGANVMWFPGNLRVAVVK